MYKVRLPYINLKSKKLSDNKLGKDDFDSSNKKKSIYMELTTSDDDEFTTTNDKSFNVKK